MSATALPNGRDLGGHVSADGRSVRSGHFIRSGMLVQPESADHVAALGVGRVFDLRTEAERVAQPDNLPGDTQLIVADVLADDPGAGPASLGRLAQLAVDRQHHGLSADELRAAFRNGYRDFVRLPSARAAARVLLETLANDDSPPVIVHCTAGKDRTGWLVALTLMALDIPHEQVMQDYLASAEPVWRMFQPFAEEYQRNGGDIEVMRVATAVYPDYLEASLDEMLATYGSLETFLTEGLDLSPDLPETLQQRLLTP